MKKPSQMLRQIFSIIAVTVSYFICYRFRDEPEKRHIFAARAEDNVVQWVMKLRECSYEYLRNKLHALQSKIYSVTGKVFVHIKLFSLTGLLIHQRSS